MWCVPPFSDLDLVYIHLARFEPDTLQPEHLVHLVEVSCIAEEALQLIEGRNAKMNVIRTSLYQHYSDTHSARRPLSQPFHCLLNCRLTVLIHNIVASCAQNPTLILPRLYFVRR